MAVAASSGVKPVEKWCNHMVKKRKFGDGGVTEGENENIDTDTRARARAWLRSQQEEGDTSPAPKAVKKATSKVVPKPAPKPAPKPVPKAEEPEYADVPKVSVAASEAPSEKPSMGTRIKNAVFPGGTQWPGEGPMSSLGAAGPAAGAAGRAIAKGAGAVGRLGRAASEGLKAGRAEANPAAAAARRYADVAKAEKQFGDRSIKAAAKRAKGEDLKEAYNPSTRGGGEDLQEFNIFKKGGKIKKYAKGGSVSSRGDGCAQRGKTRGMMR